MTVLWLNLAAVSLCALFARYFSIPAISASHATMVIPNKVLAGLAAACLIIVSGLRNNIGDTYFYRHAYAVDDFSWYTILQKKDIGFSVLQLLLRTITHDPQILIFTTALLTNLLIVIVLYKQARIFELSLFVYIASGAYIVSMNGLRQFLAAAIVFAVTHYIVTGQWKKYIAAVLFASLFHQSALVMIPMYFLVRRKAWTRATFLLLGVAILVVVGFNQFSEVLFSAIRDTQYGHYQSFDEGGANVIRVLIYAIPLYIVYIARERFQAIYPHADIIVNLSVIGTVLMIISTQNWIFARMAIYFNLYHIILVAWLPMLFRKKDRILIYLVIVIFYVLLFYYENDVTLNLKYGSDYFNL